MDSDSDDLGQEVCSEAMRMEDSSDDREESATCTQPRNKEAMNLMEFCEYCCVRKKDFSLNHSHFPLIKMTYLITELPKIVSTRWNSNVEDVPQRHGEASLRKSHIGAIFSIEQFPVISQYHVMSFDVISPPILVSESGSEPRERRDMRGLHLLDRHISVNLRFQLIEESSRGDSGSILFSKSSGLVMDDLMSAVYDAANHTRGKVVIAFNGEKESYTLPTDLIRFLTTDRAESKFAVSFVDPVLTSDWCVMVYWPDPTHCAKRTPIIGWPRKMTECKPILSSLSEAFSASCAKEEPISGSAITLVAEYIKARGNRGLNQRVSNAIGSLGTTLDNTPSSGKRTRSRLSSGAPAQEAKPPRAPKQAGLPSRAKAARVDQHGALQRTSRPTQAYSDPSTCVPRNSGVSFRSGGRQGAGSDSGDDGGGASEENGSKHDDKCLPKPLAAPQAPSKDAQRLALDTLANLVNPLQTARGDLNASEARALRLREKLTSLAAEKSAQADQLTKKVSEIQMKTRAAVPSPSQMMKWGMEGVHMEQRRDRLLAMAQAASRAAAAADSAAAQEAAAAMTKAEAEAQAAASTCTVLEEFKAQFAKNNSEDTAEGRRLQDRIVLLRNVLDAVLSQRARCEALDKQRAAAEKAARDRLEADRKLARMLAEAIAADKEELLQACERDDFREVKVCADRAEDAKVIREEIASRCKRVERELEGVLSRLSATDAAIAAAASATAPAAGNKAVRATSEGGGGKPMAAVATVSVKVKEERNGD